MSKRLILILALAFVVGITAYAYAEVQNVKVSGDLTVYGIMRELQLNNSQSGSQSNDKEQALANIVRLRIDADLTDNVTTTVRLLNERYWGSESDADSSTDIDLDLAYVTLKEFLYSPLSLTIGRQELRFGNAMIIGDVDTNAAVSTASAFSGTGDDADLSARKAFDAIRLTLNYDPLVIDIIGAKFDENDKYTDDDGDLYGINANYALNKKTTLEGYWFGAKRGRKTYTNNKNLRVDTLGARLATQPIDNLTYQLEAAYQLGKYHTSTSTTASRRAWALETALTYDFKKLRYSPSATACYAFFSGEKTSYTTDGAGRYNGWDPMFEDQKFGDIVNTLIYQTNAHVLGLIGSLKPLEDITLKGEYYAYWWDKKYPDGYASSTLRGDSVIMANKRFAGQELDVTATYDYTEDVQFSLLTGMFLPGSALDKRTDNTATQVIGSMKVTF